MYRLLYMQNCVWLLYIWNTKFGGFLFIRIGLHYQELLEGFSWLEHQFTILEAMGGDFCSALELPALWVTGQRERDSPRREQASGLL